MKSTVPWSVKGIEPEARAAAKKAAKRAGMTLGEWMNSMIINAEKPDASASDAADSPVQAPAAPGESPRTSSFPQTGPNAPVTVTQLYELVQSLNRMNERLKSSETHSRAAVTGLTEALPSVLERLKKVETRDDSPAEGAVLGRLDALEGQSRSRAEIDSLKSLEKALRQVVHQFETTQSQTLERVESSEQAIVGLSEKYRQVDNKITQAFMDIRKSVDEVNGRIAQAEDFAKTVLADAKSARAAEDAEAMAQTGHRLRSLGNEIKRTGRQIAQLEDNIKTLSGKIEASEERSSKGILDISSTIKALQEDLTAYDQRRGTLASSMVGTGHAAPPTPTPTQDQPHNTDQPGTGRPGTGQPGASQPRARTPSPSAAIRDGIGDQIADFAAPAAPDPAVMDLSEALVSNETADDALRQGDGPEPVTNDDRADKEDYRPLSPKEKVLLAAKARNRRLTSSQSDTAARTDAPAPPSPSQDGHHPDEFEDMFGDDFEDTLAADMSPPPPQAAGQQGPDGTPPNFSDPGASDIPAPPPPETDLPPPPVNMAAYPDDMPAAAAVSAPAERGGGDLRAVRDAISREQSKREQLDRDAENERRTHKRLPSKFPLILAGGAILLLLVAGSVFFFLGGARPDAVSPDAVPSGDISGDGVRPLDQPSVNDIPSPNQPEQDPMADFPGPNSRLLESTELGIDGPELYARAKSALTAAATEEEKSMAFDIMRRAAVIGGYPPAQYQLGELHREGIGVIASINTAKTWYLAAAEAGNVKAMHRLGTVTANEEDGNADSDSAISWLEQAASYGSVNSIYNLGFLFNPNNEMMARDQRDAGKSIYWFLLAANLGDEEAAQKAAEITSLVTPEKLKEIEARVAAFEPETVIAGANDLSE